MKMSEPAKKASALDTLKALAKKKPIKAQSDLVTETNDPAIAGAKKEKNVVRLGVDPDVTENAAHCAALKEALEKAKAEFEIVQGEMRDYGASKRNLYNDTFRTNVTTVNVPFTVEVPTDAASDTPGRETRFVQVVCTNKYSVEQTAVLALEEEIDETVFGKLFTKTETKTLKPNAEALVRDLLGELGLEGDDLENSMATLFDTAVKIAATKEYEQEIKKAPEAVQTVLAQNVTRVKPGLKFP
jgi:hypothetical protein